MARSRTIVIALLSAWALLLLATHRGPRSPYTYIAQRLGDAAVPVDRLANPDALTVLPVTRFFYDGARTQWEGAHNLKLPLHSFAAATVAAFVRPYRLANDATNWLFVVLLIVAAMRLAAQRGVSERAMLLALATLIALPPFVGYLGQPMQYIVGPVVSYLVIMTATALPSADLRNPWIAGALTAILTLNYDWYVFGAALAIYVLAVVRFERKRDDAIYLAVSVVPVVVWHLFLRALTGGNASTVVRNAFIETVIVEWADAGLLTPFLATHVGMHIAVHQVLALIHWPILVVCGFAAWRSGVPVHRLAVLLVVMFGIEQLVTAAFDFENNPRRALPVVFAFGCLYCAVVERRRGAWTAAFVTVFALTAFLAFADVALGRPGGGFLYMGEAIRGEPKEALRYAASELVIARESTPAQAALAQSFPPARLDLAGAWLFAQGFVGFWMAVLFVLLRRAALLPRFAPAAFAAVWLLSLAVRFV